MSGIKPPLHSGPAPADKNPRAARLEQQLRANLARRKQAARPKGETEREAQDNLADPSDPAAPNGR
jgi:hypothetical protein